MDVQHLNVKLFVEDAAQIDTTDYLTIFNEWIQDQVGEDLLVDVADYRHIHAGPAVVLVAHEASYTLDNTDGRLGLLYTRKTVIDGNAQDIIRKAILSVVEACRRLENHPTQKGKLSFHGNELLIGINDRLIAPNTGETYQSFVQELRPVLDELFNGGTYALEHNSTDPRQRFAIHVLASESASITAISETS